MKSTLSLFACFGLTLFFLYHSVQPVYAGSIVVTTTADTDADDGQCSLREALEAANADGTYRDCIVSGVPGMDTIDMTGITGTLILTGTLPFISDSVQILGPGRDNLTIDGGNLYNAFLSTSAPVTITVDGLSVINVILDGVGATRSVTVTNSLIRAEGCGVYSDERSVFVSNSEIISVGCDGVSALDFAMVQTSVISAAVDGIFVPSGSAQVISSTIKAGEDGVGVSANVHVTNTIITAVDDGIYADMGNVSAMSTTITTSNESIHAEVGDVLVVDSVLNSLTNDGIFAKGGSAQVISSTIQGGRDGVGAFANANVTHTIITATIDGVYSFTGNATVMSSTITATGSGVKAEQGDVTVTESMVNSLNEDGVDADIGNIIVDGSDIFAAESALDTDTGNIEVRNSRVIGNQDGINAIGTATVISSTVTGNTLAGIQSSTAATISNSLIINSGGDGVLAPTITIFQSTISGNAGDGVQSSSQTSISVTQSTIVNNVGYGINNAAGTNQVVNTIVAQNDGLVSTRDINGTLTGQYNLIGNGEGAGVTDGVDGNLVGSTGNLLDPQIGLLTDQISYTGTHPLEPNSPAIDHIPSNLCATAADQRGESRPKGSGCDIGAHEAGGGQITIVKTASPADGTDFAFTTNIPTIAAFTLDDAGIDDLDGFTNTLQITGLDPGVYTFTESAVAGWEVLDISCDTGSWSGDPASGLLQINLLADEVLVCTFSNVERPDLQLTKTDNDLTVRAGDTLTYTLTYTNAGSVTAGVVLTETVPLHTTFDPASSTAGWNCQEGTCTLAIGTLGRDETGMVSFVVVVDAELGEEVSQIENTAVIADDGSQGADLNPADNQAAVTTMITEPIGYIIYAPFIFKQP